MTSPCQGPRYPPSNYKKPIQARPLLGTAQNAGMYSETGSAFPQSWVTAAGHNGTSSPIFLGRKLLLASNLSSGKISWKCCPRLMRGERPRLIGVYQEASHHPQIHTPLSTPAAARRVYLTTGIQAPGAFQYRDKRPGRSQYRQCHHFLPCTFRTRSHYPIMLVSPRTTSRATSRIMSKYSMTWLCPLNVSLLKKTARASVYLTRCTPETTRGSHISLIPVI